MDTLEKTVFDSVMSRYGTLYCQFEATSSSVAELHRNYRELLSVLNPYKRNVNNIGGYRGILEKTAIELAGTFDKDSIFKVLEHENGHALAALEWEEINGIQLEVEYGVYLLHTTIFGRKRFILQPYTDFPNLEEAVLFDKAKYLEFMKYLFSHSESSSLDIQIFGARESR